jgi:uncharacterized membrane protein YczE
MKFINNNIKKRIVMMLTGIIGIGIFLSFLIEVNYGTDTSAFMNLGLSDYFDISFGTCMVLVNIVFFIPQFFLGRKLINVGTILNMVLIGYISDFCRYLWHSYLPEFLFTVQPYRIITFILALIPFLISVALYMNSDLGQVPYDAIPTILSQHLPAPYAYIRIFWDCSAILIGILAGRNLTIGTLILAVTIGPSVSFFGRFMKPADKFHTQSIRT